MSGKTSHRFVIALLTLISRLPFGVLYAVSSGLSAIAWRFRLYRYRVIDDNLRRVFPSMSDRERSHTVREYYRHLLDCMVETLKLLSISDEQLSRRISFAGMECMSADIDAGHPIILYLGHYGNWEWVPSITWHLDPRLTTAQIYRPVRDELSEAVTARVRNRFGALNIPQDKAFRTLMRLKRDGRQTITGFIADQRPNSDHLHHWMEFLGQDTPYAVGGEEIGRRIDARYYYLDVAKTGRGRYALTFKPITPELDAEYPYTAGYMRMLEQTILRAPAYWLWSHKRWSRSRQPASNPQNQQQ